MASVYCALADNLEPFDGLDPSYSAQDFLDAVESINVDNFDTPEHKYRLARASLRGAARQLLRGGPSLPVDNWDSLKQALLERFEPPIDRFQANQAFHSATQGASESVNAFAARCRELAARYERSLPPVTTDDDELDDEQIENAKRIRNELLKSDLLMTFLHGLNPKYKKYVTLRSPLTLAKAIEYAQIEEFEALTEATTNLTVAAAQPVPTAHRARCCAVSSSVCPPRDTYNDCDDYSDSNAPLDRNDRYDHDHDNDRFDRETDDDSVDYAYDEDGSEDEY